MTIQRMPPLESVLLDWARDNSYIIRDRKWKPELVAEEIARLSLGGKPALLSTMCSGMREELAAQREALGEFTASFERDIWTPTGIVTYYMHFDNTQIPPTEEGLQKILLEENRGEGELFILHHGRPIANWKSEQIPKTQREENALVKASFNPCEDANGLLDDQSLDVLYYLDQLTPRRDSFAQMFSQMRLLEYNRAGEFLTGMGAEALPFSLITYCRQDVELKGLPNNAASYRRILDYFSRAISNTLE